MRFRLVTRPPLQPLKAWFDIPNDHSVINIQDVKAQICSRVLQFADDEGAKLLSTEIGLFIDDFELLDNSSLDVIKENDLVHITRKRHSSGVRKRKVTDDHGGPISNGLRVLPFSTTSPPIHPRKKPRLSGRHRKIVARRSESSTSEDDTTSSSDTGSARTGRSSTSSSSSSSSSKSESEASSSGSSSSSSTSDSSSSSSRSSSSSSAVEFCSSKLPPSVKVSVDNVRSNPIIRRALPGKGKPTTHSRNARRRIKRLHERQQKQLEQEVVQALPTESVNAIPLGNKESTVPEVQSVTDRQSDEQPVSQVPEQGSPLEVESMVTTLRNKNKKKGFKRSMAGVTAHRITFGADDSGPPPESVSTVHSAASATPKAAPPRLITPSEKQAQGLLPANMFVSLVEVESNNWDRKKKKQQRITYGLGADGAGFKTDEALLGIDETTLNYGEPEIDWTSVERGWENMAAVEDVSSLDIGIIVGWKELSINPETFTPELLVYLGRITANDRDTSSIDVERIPRPGSDKIAFGASTNAEEFGERDSRDEAVVVETFTFEQALKAQWRIVII